MRKSGKQIEKKIRDSTRKKSETFHGIQLSTPMACNFNSFCVCVCASVFVYFILYFRSLFVELWQNGRFRQQQQLQTRISHNEFGCGEDCDEIVSVHDTANERPRFISEILDNFFLFVKQVTIVKLKRSFERPNNESYE